MNAMDDAKVARLRQLLPSLSVESAADVARAIDGIVAALRPERIYAFGSRVRDDARVDSDLDIFVVVPHTTNPPYRLDQAAYHAMGPRRMPIDVIVASRDEFERRARANSSLPATVLREGRLLYAA